MGSLSSSAIMLAVNVIGSIKFKKIKEEEEKPANFMAVDNFIACLQIACSCMCASDHVYNYVILRERERERERERDRDRETERDRDRETNRQRNETETERQKHRRKHMVVIYRKAIRIGGLRDYFR